MQLQVNRARNENLDRKGRVKSVNFHIAFQLLLSDDERNLITANRLENETIFQSEVRVVKVYELIDQTASWEFSSLDLALSIQNSVVANVSSFRGLVEAARTFEGTTTLDLE